MKNGQAVPRREEAVYETWWKNRSKSEKKLIIASAVSGILLILIGFVYLLVSNEPAVCTSSLCVRTSMELLNYIDPSQDPCEDFYRFSCGNFLLNTKLDNHSSFRSVKEIAADEIQSQVKNMLEEPLDPDDGHAFNLAKKFYRACVNESAIEAEGLNRIKQIFREMGGWPTLVGSNWPKDRFDWTNVVYKFRKKGINFDFFLIPSVQREKPDSNDYILTLNTPLFGNPKIDNGLKSLYLDYMVDVAVLLGAEKDLARKDQSAVMQFMIRCAELSKNATKVNSTQFHDQMNLSELKFAFPNIAWWEYLNNILHPVHRLNYDDVVSVPNQDLVKKLLDEVYQTDKRVLANFMAWQTLQHLINYLPSKILDKAYDYRTKIDANFTKEPRWKICVSATEDQLSGAVLAAYVKMHFDEDTKRRVLSMITNTKSQFKENLDKLDWLDEKTKATALEKVRTSIVKIPSYADLDTAVNKFYEKVDVMEDQLLMSVLNLQCANANILFGRLKSSDASTIISPPLSVKDLDIVYAPEEKLFKIPVGLFQGIFYQKDRPEYMNYGALGTVIAQEIYHIIIEAEYGDLQGELRSWWSSQSLLNYEEKLQCLGNRSSIHGNSSNRRYVEAMAIMAGFKVAYDSYTNWVQGNGVEAQLPGLNYSPNQLFWISSAIRHCAKYSDGSLHRYIANYQQSPGQFSVNGPLQNIDKFAIDFGCLPGAPMNPHAKCQIW